MQALYTLLDNAYSAIGEAMANSDAAPEGAIEKAKELLQLAKELKAFIKGGV